MPFRSRRAPLRRRFLSSPPPPPTPSNNADVLRSDEVPPLHGVDASIASLGLALGTSDPAARRARLLGAAAAAAAGGGEESDESDENDGGGVQASPSAVLAKYFLHSHGGSHGIQSLLSLLSVLAGAGAVAVAPPGGERGGGWAKLVLLRRCLLCAAARHGAGLAAAASLGARRIPAIGWLETRGRMRALALDPVAQYWFYCALLLFWAPVVRVAAPAAAAKGGKEGAAAAAAATATATATTPAAAVAMAVPWWLEGRRTSTRSLLCLLGPILLREVVSTAWVVSDCFVMLTLASSGGDEPTLLRLARGITDAGLSLIFTPSKWRGSDSAARQKMLARLVAKASLALEVLTGAILLYDAIRAFSDYSLSPVGARPSLPSVGKRILCARLYLHFLLVRRKKIRNLVGDIRGGAAQVPGKVLDALLEPKKAMGIKCDGDDAGPAPHGGAGANSSRTLWDYAKMALDF